MELETILGILTVLLTGTNIISIFQIRSIRRKSSAEADQEQIRSLNMIIAGNIQEIARLQERLDSLETKYNELYEKYIEIKRN
ncbi:MAG: hypothetical protein KBS70_03350 [Bacteroidales bacterium]|nr:hypothetical protein [Candidatus Colicola equi]